MGNDLTEHQVFWLNSVEVLAARAVYYSFKVNRYELNMLCCVQTVLSLERRKAIGIGSVMKWIGVGQQVKRKMQCYIYGLLQKGCLHRVNYKMQPDKPGNSVVISDYGASILIAYYTEVKRLEALRPAVYSTLDEMIVNSENIAEELPRYSLVKAGRDE